MADAEYQTKSTYVFSKSMRQYYYYQFSKMPMIILGVMGNVLEISIAVCLEQVVPQKIFRLDICESVHEDETIVKLALVASALHDCAQELRLEYVRGLEEAGPLATTVTPAKKETWHLPCPSVVPSPNASMPALKFKAKLDRQNNVLRKYEGKSWEMRTLFLADYFADGLPPQEGVVGSPAGKEVVVKFAVTYNADVHKLLAAKGLAPKLYACERVIGGMHMVVMERVDGTRMFDEPECSLPQSVFKDLEKALESIHEEGYVFGDFRDTNIMIKRYSLNGQAASAMVVDFDWACKDGEGMYSPTINEGLIAKELAPDVYASGPMCQRHDKWALARLVEVFCLDVEYRKATSRRLRCEEGGYPY